MAGRRVEAPAINCAVYTRKSTEEGLEQEFNSLDAQREAGEAFVASQKSEGWVCLPDRYDDGGFTGGNMERPGLKRLMSDIDAGRVDCVVVYKVDRLSRSLLDFTQIMEALEKRGVSFVSVTQQFNTTSSMGRLTLNILLSFAQFEREIISERTRDKIAAARRKGKWSGGRPVLGYDVDPRGGRLMVNESEAARVRAIFELYLDHQSLIATIKELSMAKKKVSKKKPPKTKEPPIHELYIMGEVESWHVNMVAHHKVVEVPRNQAKYEVTQRDGSVLFTRHAVSDHLELELEMVLREPVRGFDRLTFSISEWDAEEYGGISGELRYDKESGMRGGVHMSGSFPRDLYAFLLSGAKAAFEISTRSGFFRRNAWVTALAFSDAAHPQWVEGDGGLI